MVSTDSTTGSPGANTGSPGANSGSPGATIERAGRTASAPSPAGVATHCPYCSLQCGMRLTGRRTPEVAAWQEFPVNEGALCRKGWTATGLVGHRERLTTPLLRDRATGEFRQVSWDEALDVVAARLVALREEHGADSVAVFGGGGLTNEKAYQLGKFARVALGTSQIDYNGRWCMSSAATAANRAFGLDRGLPFPLADLEQTDVLVLVGSNLAETMPPAARHLDALRERGGRVVVIDPRRTPTADRADVVVQPVPGTDLALALGVLHLLVANGDVDEEYVAARTSGFDEVRRSVAAWWPERVERVTGVPVAELHELATLLGKAPKVMVLTARGAEQHSQGTDTVLAWINVALALGQCGRERAGYGCLTGQGNGQGGREHGQKADQLPGYRMIDDPAAREHVAGVWGVPPESLPGKGRSAYELLEALGTETGSRAMLVFGSNVVVSAPNATHVTERLAALDLLVVADIVLSETAALADVVLPVTQFAEETGTMTNLEGRVILRQRAITPPAGVRSDLDVLEGLAQRLDSPVPFSTDPEEVFAELGRATRGGKADYSGITYDRIRDGARRLLAVPGGGLDGLDRRAPPRHAADVPRPLRHPRRARPLPRGRAPRRRRAALRRLPGAPDDGSGARAVPVRRPDPPGPRAPRRGAVRGAAPDARRADRCGRRGTGPGQHPPRHDDRRGPRGRHDPAGHRLRAVPLGRREPAHQRRARPVQPDAGVQGVRGPGRGRAGRRWSPMSERLVVVGNGMATTRLVEELLAQGYAGHVTVLGDEPTPSYNRILLSAVLEGSHPRSAIELGGPAARADDRVTLRLGCRVLEIDRERNEVMLVDGERIGYDRLVLATGSIPTLPPIRGLVRMDGRLHPKVHAFRSLADCDRLDAAIAEAAEHRDAAASRRRRRRPARPAGGPRAHPARGRDRGRRGCRAPAVPPGGGGRRRRARPRPAPARHRGVHRHPRGPAHRCRAQKLAQSRHRNIPGHRPGGADRRRTSLDRAGPPGRADGAPGGRRRRPARLRHRRADPRDRGLRGAPRRHHRVRPAGLGAGRPARPPPHGRRRGLRRDPAASPGCAPPGSRSRSSATPRTPRATWSR